MTSTGVVLLVVGILALNALVQAAVWVPILRKRKRALLDLGEELSRASEKTVRAPVSTTFVAAAGMVVRSGMAIAALSEKRLFIQRVFGQRQVFSPGEIARVQVARRFRSRMFGGREFVILTLAGGHDAAFTVARGDGAGWQADLEKHIVAR